MTLQFLFILFIAKFIFIQYHNAATYLHQVADYFWVEPPPEPEVVEEEKNEEVSPESVVAKEMLTQKEAAKVTAEKIREQADTVQRLSAPMRPKQLSMII